MSDKIIIGVLAGYEEATQAVIDLKEAGFATKDISVLGSDPDELRMVAAEADLESKSADRVVTTCGAIGALSGLTIGLASLSIPGLGYFLAAGPIMAGLSGAAAGGMLGVIAGGLIHFDVPEYDAGIYASHVAKGNVLVAVHTSDHEKRIQAEDILDNAGALLVSTKLAGLAAAK